MVQQARKVVIIGGGVAGLCAAVYARKCGYEVDLLEQHESPGGLATRWRRGDYVFETCLHWLLGSNPDGALHEEWREVCDVDSLTFLQHEEFIRVESEDGKALHVFTDIDWLEAELLTIAPEDAEEILPAPLRVEQYGPDPARSCAWIRGAPTAEFGRQPLHSLDTDAG